MQKSLRFVPVFNGKKPDGYLLAFFNGLLTFSNWQLIFIWVIWRKLLMVCRKPVLTFACIDYNNTSELRSTSEFNMELWPDWSSSCLFSEMITKKCQFFYCICVLHKNKLLNRFRNMAFLWFASFAFNRNMRLSFRKIRKKIEIFIINK
jgi:hypothetical protein